MHTNIKQALGFTLVELIVVITIVAILSTVGFVSYSWYLTGARDSNRISQMIKLSDSLQVYSATKTLPLPDDYVEVHASWTLIAYQGEAGVDVLETIDFTNGWKDPKNDDYFTYYLTKDRKSLQLMAMMEEEGSVSLIPNNRANATDYTDRYPKVYWRKLWILTQTTTNTPIQQLSAYDSTAFDVVTETGSFVANISDEEKLEGTGATLMASNARSSCKRLKQTWNGWDNGIYTINPGGTGDIQVYCDMENAWGGWTLFWRMNENATGIWFFESNIGTYDTSIKDNGTTYTMDARNLSHTEMMITLDTSDPFVAEANFKLIMYSYEKWQLRYYGWANPCVWDNTNTFYKLKMSGSYALSPSASYCDTDNWYSRDAGGIALINLKWNLLQWVRWGAAMWWDDTWFHDAWWYAR